MSAATRGAAGRGGTPIGNLLSCSEAAGWPTRHSCEVVRQWRTHSDDGKVQTQLDYPERVFQLWSYTVGMGRLLLRSTKSEGFGTRIDVVFQNVQALQLPAVLGGLVAAPADETSTRRITAELRLDCSLT